MDRLVIKPEIGRRLTDSAETALALKTSDDALGRLLGTAQRGRILKNGVRTAIVGRPNAGKSSLLNALAGYDRAIVTDIPGTTRDTVEESVLCGDVQLRLIDTAGIRETADAVEKLGVERSRAAMESADLVLAVADGSAELTAGDLDIMTQASRSKRWIAVYTKRDLKADVRFPDSHWETPPAAVISLSNLTGEGLDKLEEAISALFPVGSHADGGTLLTDLRQEEAIRRAREAVCRAREALEAGFTPDAILTDAEEALEAIGELTGRTAREEIVDRIFSRFCVGK